MRDLLPQEATVYGRMLQKIRHTSARNRLRIQYHEAERKITQFGISIPPDMEDFQIALGWAEKTVSVTARRVRPDGWHSVGADSMHSLLKDLATESDVSLVEQLAIESAIQLGPSFVFVTPGDRSIGEPRSVSYARSAFYATCEVETRTGRTTAALEIVSNVEHILYLPGVILGLELTRGVWKVTSEVAGIPGRVMCTPYVWRKTLARPFGSSRITRPLMGLMDAGVRTFLRQEVHADIYSKPQRGLMGASEEHFTAKDGSEIQPFSARADGVWGIPDVVNEDNGELVRAQLVQLSQASFTPHSEQMRLILGLVSGETSIPAGYLGLVSENPNSADAIRAAEYDLVTVVEGEAPSINAARRDFARNLIATAEGKWDEAMSKEFLGISSHLADASTPTRSAMADSGQKFVAAHPDYAGSDIELSMWGFREDQIASMRSYAERSNAGSALDAIRERLSGQVPDADPEIATAQRLKIQAEALRSLVGSGVQGDNAALIVGLQGLEFDPNFVPSQGRS